MNWFMRVSRAMTGKQAPAEVQAHKPLFGTIIVVRLGDGSERQYRFEKVMSYREGQDVLDPILDDMDGGAIKSPVHVIRYHGNGRTTTEEVQIFNSDLFELF